MVPTIRPSPKTSILAPTRCGVEPRAEMIVTSAAGSPRSSASATAAKTSWFTDAIIRAGWAGGAGRAGREEIPSSEPRVPSPEPRASMVQVADFLRLGAGEERGAGDAGARWRGQPARREVDVHERDALGHLELDVAAAGERSRHELGPDRQCGLGAGEAERLVVVESYPDHREQLRREADEPCVALIVGGAGLAGGVERKALRPCGGRRAEVEHAAHHVEDEVGRRGPRDR